MIDFLGFSCPLILASVGALFSEYAGCLALFLDGLITFAGFLTYTFTVLTHSFFLGIFCSVLICSLIAFLFAFIVHKTKANVFIAAISMNLLFSAMVSLFSSLIFSTRGILTDSAFSFNLQKVDIITITATFLLLAITVYFLKYTQQGIYFRIAGSNSDILQIKGVNPVFYKILSWTITGFYACTAGSILAFRTSSFVPNISSSKGWMALAAVFMGKKNPLKIIIFVIFFCLIDFASVYIQNFIPSIPTSILLSLPYIVSILIILGSK